MLELRKITKTYHSGNFEQKALNKVSVNFRKSEFASILGPSGSGKTTLLNIIGGLDHYTSGDLVINEVSTKEFKDKDWDSYRNHRIGFVFQSYNLIPHQTVLQNVKLALTLSGITKKDATLRAKDALKKVGLSAHINKRPNQLSGGQMQRVAIARALVNDPEILLADEPTGALDSETSVQIMEILKDVAKDRLVIMVTHNPELAKEYSTRIIELKDGRITSDSNPYDGKVDTRESSEVNKKKFRHTKMSYFTALSLSFNNLLTKKGRTILVAFAGSIGIIGIALILAVSTGFQNYVDHIQEETLGSYPLIFEESATDMTSVLLGVGENTDTKSSDGKKVSESQLLTSMVNSVGVNDLKSFKSYLENNRSEVENDLSSISYQYSIDPIIYTIDATNNLAKLNPSSLFTSMLGGSSVLSSYSSLTSVFRQISSNEDLLNKNYDLLAGHFPTSYNEVILILPNDHTISDFLVYSLGLRNTKELSDIMTKLLNNETVNIKNEPLSFTYDDLMNIELKFIEPSKLYKYNDKYDVYENMSDDENYMRSLYSEAEQLKIVGIASVNASISTGGIGYLPSLIQHISNYAATTDVVRKQLENPEIDIFSGNRFDEKKNNFDFSFSDLVSVDEQKLAAAFGGGIDENTIKNQVETSINEISSSIVVNPGKAKTDFVTMLNQLIDDTYSNINSPLDVVVDGSGNILGADADYTGDRTNTTVVSFNTLKSTDIDNIVASSLNTYSVNETLTSFESTYHIPKSMFYETYNSILETILSTYSTNISPLFPTLNPTGSTTITTVLDQTTYNTIKDSILTNYLMVTKIEGFANVMNETAIKVTVLTKIGNLTANLTDSFAKAMNINPDAITSAFTLNFSEDELARVVQAMFSKTESTQKSNLINLGYQDLEDPTYISFYFSSFDGKEHFLEFVDNYNVKMAESGNKEKVIEYSDTTGLLMSSVKTIVDAVSYVLIAFVSISLVVSSIMIGIITYISVYERTKEIGILRAIGASKHNISSIFNAETFIIGLLSGIFGIGISYLFIPIINAILHHFTGDIPLSAALATNSAIILIIVSIILTLIGGLIPAKSASKKDPVEALRSE